ncbi:MAG: BatA domain-containing protein [Isosphaeraceae bacterium]
MEMSLMHAGLAAGAALAALPVILHLFMRQTPKHMMFPALRLIRERQRRSKKRMRIKNWLLLLARMAVLALMALALARPTIYSQVPLGDQSVPTALGLVFDTSLSMKYRDKDKTRLDEAKERAREIVEKLPDSSLVFVVDSSEPGVTGLSPAAARKRIDGLTTHSVGRQLNVAMGEAYEAVAACDRPVHMVYVLTDLARTGWNPDRPAEGLDKVAKIKSAKAAKMATFVIRLTPQEIHNVSVDSAELPQTPTIQGESVEIRSRIRSQGPATNRLVEFYVDGVKKGEKTVQIPPDSQVEVSFPTPPMLKEGELHRGEIVLKGTPDPLEDDDRRFFTFKVRPPLKVLIVADHPEDSEFVTAALDYDTSPSSPKTFLVKSIRSAGLGRLDQDTLKTYACIFLLNIARLSDKDWGALNGYVHNGGGLVVGAGNACDPANYDNGIPPQFLPAQLGDRKNLPPESSFGKVTDITHPLFSSYGKDFDSELGQVPVYRYWTVKAPSQPIEGARPLLVFADGAPALIERAFKGPKPGRVLLWTTPLSKRAYRTDPDAWNEFPNLQFWSFPVLMNLTVPYMAGTSTEQLNFEAGEPVLLKLDPNAHLTSFAVKGPDGKTADVRPPSGHEFLEVASAQTPGQWDIKATSDDKRTSTLGFSMNPPRAESQFTLLQKQDLDTIFGKDGYVLAEDAQALKKEEGLARFGYEAFPTLMILILIVVTLENFLANTFYKEAPKPNAAGAVS